ncbi:MAG: mannose-1-phosphate guanylyltransferase [Candidatus Aminicenantes bacterium]
MERYAVIMAGGVGTRFWPLSRTQQPKQFLPIISERTMLEETIRRIQPFIPLSRIVTIANRNHSEVIRRIFPALPAENVIVEPMGKNTAPCLLLATAGIYRRNPEAVLTVLPADHLIRKPDVFRRKLAAAADAGEQSGDLITFGIPPSYPATGYGYIRFDRNQPMRLKNESFFHVREFKEKPGREQALEFLNAGTYYWNSGMFIWRADGFSSKIKKFAPDWYPFWKKILDDYEEPEKLKRLFEDMPATSIDYALMEKASGVLMAEGDFGWSDVGSWSSLFDIWPQDENSNALRTEGIAIDSKNNLVHNPGRLTALVGVQDMIVVDTPDALLICRKDMDQKVKDIVAELKTKKRSRLL